MATRTYTFKTPTTDDEMWTLLHIYNTSKSDAKREAASAVFERMACQHGYIIVESRVFYFNRGASMVEPKHTITTCPHCEAAQPAVVETPEVESEQDEEYEEPREDLYRECEARNDSSIPSDITLTVGEATVANDAQYVYWCEQLETTSVCTECDELHHAQDTLCPKCRAFYQHGLDLCNKFDEQTSRPLQQNDRIEKLLHTGMTYEQIQIAVKALDAARTQLEHLASKEQGDQQNEDTTIYHQEIERGLHGR